DDGDNMLTAAANNDFESYTFDHKGYVWVSTGQGDNTIEVSATRPSTWLSSLTVNDGIGNNTYKIDPGSSGLGPINIGRAAESTGSDTLDLSALAGDQTIDLRGDSDGGTVNAGGLTLAFTDGSYGNEPAEQSIIQNVITGQGYATVYGNGLDNTFTSGSGG